MLRDRIRTPKVEKLLLWSDQSVTLGNNVAIRLSMQYVICSRKPNLQIRYALVSSKLGKFTGFG
jgi:hypothetical protein